MQDIFCYPSRVLCLELLGQHFFFFSNSWLKSSVEGMLIDFVNDLVWEGIMNTFDDIGGY